MGSLASGYGVDPRLLQGQLQVEKRWLPPRLGSGAQTHPGMPGHLLSSLYPLATCAAGVPLPGAQCPGMSDAVEEKWTH